MEHHGALVLCEATSTEVGQGQLPELVTVDAVVGGEDQSIAEDGEVGRAAPRAAGVQVQHAGSGFRAVGDPELAAADVVLSGEDVRVACGGEVTGELRVAGGAV